ncbi:hypothetical protein [Kitasatospora paranensis]|uniref:Uncharacterized protein n=2 Tax=Kitasatospora paranensis TaxID=258053 RepID=A0ABW2G2L0_9ACTN
MSASFVVGAPIVARRAAPTRDGAAGPAAEAETFDRGDDRADGGADLADLGGWLPGSSEFGMA